MATVNMAYDHPQYTVHSIVSFPEGGAGTVAFARFVAAVACQAFSATYTVTTAGTTTTSGVTSMSFVKVSGTTTTTAKFVQLSSANTAYVTATNVTLSGSNGGLALAQGDVLQCIQGTDATAKGMVSYEIGFAPGASVTS